MAFGVARFIFFNFLLFSTTTQAQTSGSPEAPPPLTCPAGGPIGAVDLQVHSLTSSEALPFETIIHLSEGDTVVYQPLTKNKEKRVGEVSLVMVPAKHTDKEASLIVTDPKPAAKSAEWTVPQTVTLAAFVYGPGGLSKKKVAGFLSQDDQLVAQLADYAEKTSQVEELLSALSENSTAAGMNAALSGFASQYGLAIQIDKNAPPAVQAQTLFSTMNPQLASYNPLASNTGERVGQTASLATAAATLFFGSPIGLAAGGTAMLMDLRYIAFPDTVFRSSFAQPLPKGGVNLCGQRGPLPPHSRVAYIWASRIPNAATPKIEIKSANYIPETLKTAVPVEVGEPGWKYLQRARKWRLVSEKGAKTDVSVIKLGNQRELEIGLDKANVKEGDYRLEAFWDWTTLRVEGLIHVRPLSDFREARLDAGSQNVLLANEGEIAVTLAGSDFEFTNKVELKKRGDEFAVAEPLRFLLPKGLHNGPQNKMDVQIDTAHLDPGKYDLLISQDDGKARTVEVSILPNAPKISNLPVLLNEGLAVQHFVLKGERLQLLERLESTIADLHLEKATGGSERNVTAQLKGAPKSGNSDDLTAYLNDRSEPLRLANAVQITGPLPLIASSKLSLPSGLAITLLPEEFPAGYTLTELLDVKNIKPQSVLSLYCAEGVGARPALRLGEQNSKSSLQQLSTDQLFVSYDTGELPAGCTLMGLIDNGVDGKSQPLELAKIRRFPQVESFIETSGTAGNGGLRSYEMRGFNLEMIERAGWSEQTGHSVNGLPAPIPGMGQQQSLVLNLEEPPAPKATLFLWLRGEGNARATTISLTP